MDVDAANPNPIPSAAAATTGDAGAARSIKLHPLAIIGISDHHTRVITGGSALPPSAPVVGLLFGYYSSDGGGGGGGGGSSGRDVSIVDAEEMEYPNMSSEGGGLGGGGDGHDPHRAAVLQKIELHQKVFPQHKVVGWYRVRKHDEPSMNADDGASDAAVMPSEEDLRMNQTEMARYCSGSGNQNDGGGGEEEEGESPLFVLMNSSKTTDSGDKKPSSMSSSSTNNASEEMEVDEELPLTVYETLAAPEAGGGGAVFVNVDFELETYEPERIAVEKVFKTQPSKSAAQSAATASADALGKDKGDASNRKTGKKSKKDESGEQKHQRQSSKPAFTRGPTELDSQVDSLQSSIRAMNVRMNVLLEYLRKVERGEVEADDALLRSVDGLVRQLPLVLAALEEGQASSSSFSSAGHAGRTPLRELEHEQENTMLLTYLAAVAKTARSVHVYTEKFRNACESAKSDPRRPLY
eukprot:CAMPEP_0172552948 /NCGR_PEP_ID=MMETSP1067-20121228/47309_1 /TAXON_ID=265564 ORGANISM="Thalassiosira punctigera, Strain Tpunct2005C2" /NCGR_SAMPLE_ID=MMETSP1067 /ASSEMBLY_ACC=CAM_ASM_000444 /LENGTH=466 /DNA_ID=CAMNT_0013341025 /DNA_START=30 /DNA_END=1430 /DNA_ORIENTATION=-